MLDTSKRYQVFVSSTFIDLQEERQAVFRKILALPCFPAGMEWFPAQTEEQWKVIQRVIDSCDYYVLIIGNRYGSTTKEGLSYTEKEFDYAVSKGIPVLVFPHKNPGSIAFNKSDADEDKRLKLQAFRQKAMADRMVDFWNTPDDLASSVAVALVTAMTNLPGIGWVRGDMVASEEILSDLHKANKKIQEQADQIKELASRFEAIDESIEGIESLDKKTNVTIFTAEYGKEDSRSHDKRYLERWWDIFHAFSRCLLYNSAQDYIIEHHIIAQFDLGRNIPKHDLNYGPRLDPADFDRIKIHLQAHNLVHVTLDPSEEAHFWKLTPRGRRIALQYLSYLSNPNF